MRLRFLMVTPTANPDIKRQMDRLKQEEIERKMEVDRIALAMETIYEVMEDGPTFTVGEEFDIVPQRVVPPVSGYVSSVDPDCGSFVVCDIPVEYPPKPARWYQDRSR